MYLTLANTKDKRNEIHTKNRKYAVTRSENNKFHVFVTGQITLCSSRRQTNLSAKKLKHNKN